jgi:hypothetical protein
MSETTDSGLTEVPEIDLLVEAKKIVDDLLALLPGFPNGSVEKILVEPEGGAKPRPGRKSIAQEALDATRTNVATQHASLTAWQIELRKAFIAFVHQKLLLEVDSRKAILDLQTQKREAIAAEANLIDGLPNRFGLLHGSWRVCQGVAMDLEGFTGQRPTVPENPQELSDGWLIVIDDGIGGRHSLNTETGSVLHEVPGVKPFTTQVDAKGIDPDTWSDFEVRMRTSATRRGLQLPCRVPERVQIAFYGDELVDDRRIPVVIIRGDGEPVFGLLVDDTTEVVTVAASEDEEAAEQFRKGTGIDSRLTP